jgi:hypothetical protein
VRQQKKLKECEKNEREIAIAVLGCLKDEKGGWKASARVNLLRN